MIFNTTRKTTLCSTEEVASTPFQKARGLMFRTSLKGGMLFSFFPPTRADIWTLGMLFPIDILWISKQWKVLHTKERARPWAYCGFSPKKASFVLEVKAGVIKRTRTRVGDLLTRKAVSRSSGHHPRS